MASEMVVEEEEAFGYYVIDPTHEAPAFLAVHHTLLMEVFPTTFLYGLPEQHDYRWRVSFWRDKETRLSRDLLFSLSESSCSSLLHALDFTHLYPLKVESCFLLVELIHRASGAPLSIGSKSLRLPSTCMSRVSLCKEDMFGARLSFVSTYSQATQWRCASREIKYHSNDLVAEQVHFLHVDDLQMAPDLLELSSSERILVNATCVVNESMSNVPQKTPSFLGEKTGTTSFDWITSSEFSFQAASEIKISVIGMNTNSSSSSSSSSSGGSNANATGIRYAELCCGSFVPSSSSSIVSREVCLYTHPTAVIVGDESSCLEKTLVGKITITLAGNDEKNDKNVLANVLKASSALPVWVWEADDALFRELGSEEAISCLAACARRVAFGSPLAKKIVLSPTSKQQQATQQSPFSPSGRSEEENTELIMHVVSKLALALSNQHKLGDPASFAEQASIVDKFGAMPILWTYFQYWLGGALVNKLIAGASSLEMNRVDLTTTTTSNSSVQVLVPSQELSLAEIDSIRGACWSLRVLSYSGHIERIHGHFLSPPSLVEKQDHITTQGIAEDLLHTILAFAGNNKGAQTGALVQNASTLLPLVGDLSLEVCAATAVLATNAAPNNTSLLSSFLSICLLHQPLGISMFKKALPLSWSRSSAVRTPITCYDLLTGAMLEVAKACKGTKEYSSMEMTSLYSLSTTLTKLLFSTSQAPLALSSSSTSTPLLSTQILPSPSPAILPPSGARRKKTNANGKVTVTSHLLSMLEKQQQQQAANDDAEGNPKRLALLFLGERYSFLDSLLLCTKAISTTMAASQLLDQLLETLPAFPLSVELQEGGVGQSIVLLVSRVAAAINIYWQSSTPAISSFALHLSLLSEFVHFFFLRATTDETLSEAEVASYSLSLSSTSSSSIGVVTTATHNTISCWLGLRQQLLVACFGVLRAIIKLCMLQGDDEMTGREKEDSQLVWLIRELSELGPLVTTRPDLAVLCLPSTEADTKRVMFDLFATALDVPGRTNKLNMLCACINTMHLVSFNNLESLLQCLVDGSVLRCFRNANGNYNTPPLILSLLQEENSQNLFDSNSPEECAHVLQCLMHLLSDPRSTGDASSSSLQSPLPPPSQITLMRERFRRRLAAIKLYVSSAEKKRTEYDTLVAAASLSTLLQLSSSSTSLKQQEIIVTEITNLVPCSTFAGSHGAGQALAISSILSSLDNLPDPRYHHHYLESVHKASRLALGMMLQTGEWEAGVTFVKQLLKQNNDNVIVNKQRQKAISLELTGIQEKLLQRLVHDGDLRPLPLHYAVRFSSSPWGTVDALSYEARVADKDGDEEGGQTLHAKGEGGQDVEEDVWLLLRFDASSFCACAEEFASIDASPGSCSVPGPCSVSIQRALLNAFPSFTLAPSTTLAEPKSIGTKRPRIMQVFQAFFAKPNGEEEHDAEGNEDAGNKSTDDGGGGEGGDAHSHTITRMDTTLSLSATVVGDEDEYEQSAVFRAHDGLRRGGNSDAAPLGIWERAMHAEVFHVYTGISSEAGGGSGGEESVVRITLTCRSGFEVEGSSGSIRTSKLDKIQSHLVPANLLFVTAKKKVTAFDAGLSVICIQQMVLERLYAALKRVAAQGPSELASSSSSHIEHKNIMSTHAIMSACVIAICNMYVPPSCLCVGIHNSLCLLAGESDRLETRWQKQRKQLKKVQMRMKSEFEAQVREAELHGFEMPEEPPAFDLSELEAEHLEAKQSLMRLTARRDRCLDLISGILLDLRVCTKSWVSSLSFARSTTEREHEKLVWTQVILWLEANTEEQLALGTTN